MNTLREAAQQALEAYDQHEPLAVVMEALRAALADGDKLSPGEPVQSAEHGEPVAYLWVDPETLDYVVDRCDHPLTELIPVYTAPPQCPAEPGSLMVAAQRFLEWNRAQIPPPVAVGFELGVFEAVKQAYTFPPQRKENNDE